MFFILLALFHLSLVSNIFFFSYGLQNKRGGRVKLQPMVMPQSEFDHSEKGDALYGKLQFPVSEIVDEEKSQKIVPLNL